MPQEIRLEVNYRFSLIKDKKYEILKKEDPGRQDFVQSFSIQAQICKQQEQPLTFSDTKEFPVSWFSLRMPLALNFCLRYSGKFFAIEFCPDSLLTSAFVWLVFWPSRSFLSNDEAKLCQKILVKAIQREEIFLPLYTEAPQ